MTDDHGLRSEGPSEDEMLLMSMQASSTLAAMATGQHQMVLAQIENIWKKSCMAKVFYMATWVGMAGQAAAQAGVELTMAIGDDDGRPKANPTPEDTVAEAFMNLMLNDDNGKAEEAIELMHDYLHESDDRSGRAVFICVLGATASATRRFMEQAKGLFANVPAVPDDISGI